ncbi:MAG: D-alanyl-D-alanine carboxypeptidase family protein [Veillonellales bacterium]
MITIKLRLTALCLFLLTVFSPIGFGAGIAPDVTAKAAIVMEASTGKVLYEKNGEERHYPASTTKMMTLILALENGSMDDVVTVSDNAANTEGSSMELAAGEQLKLRDLLYGIALVSGNDATVAVAEHLSGSVENFARLMTQKAHAIGAVNTNFVNSSGLPDPNHYSTAHDLARIAAYGYKNPAFAEIVGCRHQTVSREGWTQELYNENKMLRNYQGGNGVKTGYTIAAGRCLVSGAKRGNVQLIAVVLNSPDMWEDSTALLDFGFSQVQAFDVFHEGDVLKTVKVTHGKKDFINLVAGENLSVPLFSPNDRSRFQTVFEVPDTIQAPVTQGQKVGIAKVLYQNKEVGRVNLVAAESIDQKSLRELLQEMRQKK